jgi:N-methylhydantoinase B
MTLDAVGLEVMAHTFAGVAEEMGALIVASSLSPNIRERRDLSAAVFLADGTMLAQAAHIPVHLGAMPEAVEAVRALDPVPGDVFAINDPFMGGTHLPDLTLVGAVEVEGVVGAYTVVRAHHSDIGGMVPGSMPAGAREIYQEGLIVPPVRLVRAGRVNTDVERLILANVRTPEIRRGDLAAQLAAVERGAVRWRELVARYGQDTLAGAARDLLDYTERLARDAVSRLRAGEHRAEDWMEGDGVDDDDLRIVASVRSERGVLHVDFAGTAPAARGNVNCPIAVTHSAVLFALRAMLAGEAPTNGGLQRAVRVTAPAGCLVNARWPSAVAAGNVETSQRITDTVFQALALAGAPLNAPGQGTMNNVTLGGPGWTYYETIAGGQGAGERGPGPSAVHVGMSNTQNTPVEVLELELPIRVRRYAIRWGSGGAGRHHGGDGVIRELEVLAPADANLLTERRRRGPPGLEGGDAGAPGANAVDGTSVGSKVALRLRAGQVLTVETPGGGGWGGPSSA